MLIKQKAEIYFINDNIQSILNKKLNVTTVVNPTELNILISVSFLVNYLVFFIELYLL